MVEYVKSNEERWIDAVIEIVAALLAGSNDRIYPAHIRAMLPAVETLLAKARDDGNTGLVRSLEHSLQKLESMMPSA